MVQKDWIFLTHAMKKCTCSKISKKDSRANAFLWTLRNFSAWNFIKYETWHRCFPVNFPKFLRTFYLLNICEGLLLMIWSLKIPLQGLLFIKMGKKCNTRIYNLSSGPHIGNFLAVVSKERKNVVHSSYKAVWRIPKLLLIAYEKMFIARN